MAARPALIGLDWGTTSLRGFLMTDTGTVLEKTSSRLGVAQLGDKTFQDALNEIAGSWIATDPTLPIIASGMIGSTLGWVEAPYVECPADPNTLSKQLTAVPGVNMSIVPGVCQTGENANVMRGEETQIIGALSRIEETKGPVTFVLPGTHSKWVQVEAGHITSFHTWMTGELFDIISHHSVISASIDKHTQTEALDADFVQGVKRAKANGDFGTDLFFARAGVLCKELAPRSVSSFLSGLLIGSEIAGASKKGITSAKRVYVISSESQYSRYAHALDLFKIRSTHIEADTIARGLCSIEMSSRKTTLSLAT